MSKTPFGSKCEIMGDLWASFKDREDMSDGWSELFLYNDLGFPLAYMVARKLATAKKPEGIDMINETWADLCDALGIDTEGSYSTAIDVLKSSEFYKDMDFSDIED